MEDEAHLIAPRWRRMFGYWWRLPGYLAFRFGLLLRASSTYFGDRVGTLNHVAFMFDQRFLAAYTGAFEGIPSQDRRRVMDLDIRWRAHIVTWAGNQALRTGGDFVECGVWYGILSKTMLDFLPIDASGARFFLVDAWGGEQAAHPDYSADLYGFVERRFRNHPSVRLCRGRIPDVLSSVDAERIGFLGIDLNGSVAERATLECFYSRVVPGGVIYFDDYGYEFPELRETVDDFFSNKPEELLHFPTGQSIVVKL